MNPAGVPHDMHHVRSGTAMLLHLRHRVRDAIGDAEDDGRITRAERRALLRQLYGAEGRHGVEAFIHGLHVCYGISPRRHGYRKAPAAHPAAKRNPEMIATNSLGRPIATTEAGLRAFWKWFGDSKVVDARGRPLVVYHGVEAPVADFTSFRTSRTGALGPGIYATSDRKVANEYTGAPWKRQTPGQRIYPLYVRLLHPFIEGAKTPCMWDTFNPNREPVDDAEIQRRMLAAGFDGIIGKGGAANVAARRGEIDVVAFRGDQVKSAIGNRGTFDPADPVITNPRRNPPIPYEPPNLAGMRVLKGFRPAAQRHEHTCGPACLRAVLHYFGRQADEHLLAEACGTTKASGTTPEGMLGALVQLHYRATIKRRASVAWCIDQLKRDRPVMLLWNDWKGHWVVLIGYNPENGNLLLADPANRRTGLRVHTPATLRRHWTARVGGRLYNRVAIAVG